jgi:hypothetical protein
MKIIQTLKDGKKQNIVPLENPTFSTMHEEYLNTVIHRGFLLEAKVAPESDKYEGHKFGILFEVEEDITKLEEALGKVKARFLLEKLGE